jgi:GMP synthase-like glutamine amidotransferase
VTALDGVNLPARAAQRPDNARRVLVLTHHPDEDPGTLGALLEGAGFTLETVELDAGEAIPEVDPFDLLVVMGGPQHVWEEKKHPWLVDEKAAVRRWVAELGRPCLGVCLGHQLVADALGGTVRAMAVPEIGVNDIELTPEGVADPVVGMLPRRLPGLQWHEAEVVQPPPGAVVLARNEHSPVQALRVAPLTWCVQFHLEVGPGTVPKWAGVPEYERTLIATLGRTQVLEDAVRNHLTAMTIATANLVAAFLKTAFAISPTGASEETTSATGCLT